MAFFLALFFLGIVHTCLGASHSLGPWVLGMQKEYKVWSLGRVFRVGDTLEFEYLAGVHSVVELSSQEAYDSCDLSNPVNVFNQASAVVTLPSVGKHFYVCGMPGHCDGGMKVTVNVVEANAPAPPPAAERKGSRKQRKERKFHSPPAPAPVASPPPPPSKWSSYGESCPPSAGWSPVPAPEPETWWKKSEGWSPAPAPAAYGEVTKWNSQEKHYSPPKEGEWSSKYTSSPPVEWSPLPAPTGGSSYESSPPSPPEDSNPVPAPTSWGSSYENPRKYGP